MEGMKPTDYGKRSQVFFPLRKPEHFICGLDIVRGGNGNLLQYSFAWKIP